MSHGIHAEKEIPRSQWLDSFVRRLSVLPLKRRSVLTNKKNRECFHERNNSRENTYHKSIEINCPSISSFKKDDRHRSQIYSPSIEIDEESIVYRLKSMEVKPEYCIKQNLTPKDADVSKTK